MKKTTIITIAAIILGFVFWNVVPGILATLESAKRTLNVDATTTVSLKSIDILTIESGHEGKESDIDRTYNYTLPLTIRIDERTEGIRITVPKEVLTINTMASKDGNGGQEAYIKFTPQFRAMASDVDLVLLTMQAPDPNATIDEQYHAYRTMAIPITLTMNRQTFHHIMGDGQMDKPTPGKSDRCKIKLSPLCNLTIEGLEDTALNLCTDHSVYLEKCKLQQANIDVKINMLSLKQAKINQLTFHSSRARETDYNSSTLNTDILSHIKQLTITGEGDVDVDKPCIDHIMLHPQGKGIDIRLQNIKTDMEVK